MNELPFVFINMAMTADGKIATANREVASFSSKRDQVHLLELRATADAVMCAARTLEAGPIALSPGASQYREQRKRRGLREYNLRVVVSGKGSIRTDSRIFQRRFSPIIVLASERISPARLKALKGIADAVHVCGCEEIDFRAALAWLRREWNVKRLLCEGGGIVNTSLFRAGVVNEVHLTVCPWIFGGRQAPTIADGEGFADLASAARLRLKSVKREGQELFLVYEVRKNKKLGSA